MKMVQAIFDHFFVNILCRVIDDTVSLHYLFAFKILLVYARLDLTHNSKNGAPT